MTVGRPLGRAGGALGAQARHAQGRRCGRAGRPAVRSLPPLQNLSRLTRFSKPQLRRRATKLLGRIGERRCGDKAPAQRARGLKPAPPLRLEDIQRTCNSPHYLGIVETNGRNWPPLPIFEPTSLPCHVKPASAKQIKRSQPTHLTDSWPVLPPGLSYHRRPSLHVQPLAGCSLRRTHIAQRDHRAERR